MDNLINKKISLDLTLSKLKQMISKINTNDK